jgi:hypothetical protein
MTVPLDRLYHFIQTLAETIYGDSVIIYRFYPHGTKNIENLNPLGPCGWFERTLYPQIYCHDQEPLNHSYYCENIKNLDSDWRQLEQSIIKRPTKNLNYNANTSVFKKTLLLISEKRSGDLEKYQQFDNMIPVYYWNHAFLSRDWFRYSQHETFLKNSQRTFLIYNRAWSGSREYRLKFMDLLIDNKLIQHCQTSFNTVDPESQQHYSNYSFVNLQWKPCHTLENFLSPTQASSASSADFETNDYNVTDIEVVLETLFDDHRIYLTEKTLRPMACGQPFILASTPGVLEYVRSYGFKTFDSVWDESYDQITDPGQRMQYIVDLMKQISCWDNNTRSIKLQQARNIADYNRQWFFSDDFWKLINNELETNLSEALKEFNSCDNYRSWINHWGTLLNNDSVEDFLISNTDVYKPTKEVINKCMGIAKQKLFGAT